MHMTDCWLSNIDGLYNSGSISYVFVNHIWPYAYILAFHFSTKDTNLINDNVMNIITYFVKLCTVVADIVGFRWGENNELGKYYTRNTHIIYVLVF
jgi:hypothetical protein